MNKEIKIDGNSIRIGNKVCYCVDKDILDCMTNLQQENESKTHQIEVLDEVVNYERHIRNDKLQQENKELKKNQRYYKNGVFSLEYDKETLSDMVDDYKSRCKKASNKLDSMFANGEENKILDDLLELDKIVKGDK